MKKNILFIMYDYDQLHHDYLGCAGHKTLHTPHMDRLAAMGTRFSNAYVQSPVCGASRMSFYTGRYVSSHGAAWNNFPLKVGEMTLGDHLRKLGVDSWLIGKTHMKADAEGMERLGITRESVIGARVAECGFDVWLRDDGLHAEGPAGFYDERRSPYNEYLKAKGYSGDNPWHDHANAADDGGEIASGWFMRHAAKPANIAEEDSETPWLTGRVIDFLDEQDDGWLCHASFIKPHWPYIVPAPYHAMYGHNQLQPPVRVESERADPHPVYKAFMDSPVGQAFSRDEVRETVLPAYMGLIKQADDQLGRLLDHLEATGRMANTMIVLTSDHGDYMGDHWLGEKDLFHAPSVKVPLIVVDPDAPDSTRGRVVDDPVEAIDLAPTFIEFMGGKVPEHILEGRSLLPWLRGETPEWRDYAISEYDYSCTPMRKTLGLTPRDARLFMVADRRFTFMHAEGGFPPMLFDRDRDPDELHDVGRDPAYADTVAQMYGRLAKWARRMAQRTTVSDEQIEARSGGSEDVGIFIGVFDESEVAPEYCAQISGRAKPCP